MVGLIDSAISRTLLNRVYLPVVNAMVRYCNDYCCDVMCSSLLHDCLLLRLCFFRCCFGSLIADGAFQFLGGPAPFSQTHRHSIASMHPPLFQNSNAIKPKTKTMTEPDYALEIDPEGSLQFTITRDPVSEGSDGSSRCTMTLRNPGRTNGSLAFKVRSLEK